jgi:hypothetical protein
MTAVPILDHMAALAAPIRETAHYIEYSRQKRDR